MQWQSMPIVMRRLVLTALIMVAGSAVTQAQTVFINEIHYDNDGTDNGEAIEIAGPAGTDLTGWSIVRYNGANGSVYTSPVADPSGSDTLSGIIPDLGSGFGVIVVNYLQDGLQNGAPDGIALVDSNGIVKQFLSYEGSFTAVGGPAAGMTSRDLGVAEGASTPVGASLQLTGTGSAYSDFTWNSLASNTFGAINAGQTFASGDVSPSVTSTTPSNGDDNVALDADVMIMFSEDVEVFDPWFAIDCTSSGIVTATVTGGPRTYTLDPDADFVSGETCTVTILAAQIGDQDGTSLPANVTFSFQTAVVQVCGDPATLIHDIQGDGLASTLVGRTVVIEGVVVGDFQNNGQPDNGELNGFFVQEEDTQVDGNPETSEGIFAFYPSAIDVQVGDVVRLSAEVSEFNGLTELSNVSSLEICPVPASASATVIELPLPDTSSYLERFEGMLVTLPQALTIAEYFNFDRFGEIVLALPFDGEERLYQPTSVVAPGAAANALQAKNNLRRIMIDDGRPNQNPDPAIHPNGSVFNLDNRFRGGDTVANVTGVVDYAFGLYRIQATQGADYVNANPRTLAPDPVGGRLKVASFNVLNYFTTLNYPTGDPLDNKCGPLENQECRGADADQPLEFTRQRDKIIAALTAIDADVVGLIEIENHPGDVPTADLVSGLNQVIDPDTYAYITTGAIGTDAIRVALIYKPATVTPVGNYAILDASVDRRFLDNLNRPVLAQTFQDNSTGGVFTVAVNHLKSKGSDCNDVGDPDVGDGAGNCNLTRKAAAEALVDWLATDPTDSGDPDFLIIGDLNSYDKEEPLDAIRNGADDVLGTGDDYTDLVFRFLGELAYSYVFDGQVGYLDHALANQPLNSQVTSATIWHINADEPDILDYDTSFKQDAQDALYEPNAYRASDHDPVIIGLALTPAPLACDCSNPRAIRGTARADLLIGTQGDDILCGFDGNDVIFGLGGNDCIDGGSGHDTIFAGFGNDLVLGGNDNDVLLGGPGKDRLDGGAGFDSLSGGLGSDTCSNGEMVTNCEQSSQSSQFATSSLAR